MTVHPWFQTMFDLSQTTSPVELWTALLIPHGTDTSWDASEPYALFKRMHAADSTYASITALLLCTDHRWHGAAHRLIRQLSGSGMLDEQDLRRLSEWFMAVEVHVCAPHRLFPRRRVVPVVDVAVRDCAVQDDAQATSGLAESPTVHSSLVDSLSAEAPVVELPVGNTAAGGAATNRRASMVRIARPAWPALKRVGGRSSGALRHAQLGRAFRNRRGDEVIQFCGTASRCHGRDRCVASDPTRGRRGGRHGIEAPERPARLASGARRTPRDRRSDSQSVRRSIRQRPGLGEVGKPPEPVQKL